MFEVRFSLAGCALLHHHTTAVPAVGTDWAWTVAVSHVHPVDVGSDGAVDEWWMEVFAKLDVDQIIFPAGWAVHGDVLHAH